jgi:hypothetical protein
MSDDFPFVDARLVLAELGGSVTALEMLIEARAGARVYKGRVR